MDRKTINNDVRNMERAINYIIESNKQLDIKFKQTYNYTFKSKINIEYPGNIIFNDLPLSIKYNICKHIIGIIINRYIHFTICKCFFKSCFIMKKIVLKDKHYNLIHKINNI
jgi:hypothetical protein